MHITDKILYNYKQRNREQLRAKSISLNRQQSYFFTSIAPMYKNTMIIYRGDRLNLESDMSFFHTINSVFYGKYVRKAVLFKAGTENDVETLGEW